MKASSSAALAEPSTTSNRRQPVRQTRTNPPRNALGASRTAGSSALGGPQNGAKPAAAPGFFPGITYFTDAITALPKEMIRHYTMLKEVDAKLYSPEEQLTQLVSEALDGRFRGFPVVGNHIPIQGQHAACISLPSGLNHTNDPLANHLGAAAANPPDPRTDHYELMRNLMIEVLKISDEKNHVMSNANDALYEHLGRLESCWPEIEKEISEETRLGNLRHWAYTDRSTDKKTTTATERTRREVATANNTHAAAGAGGDNEGGASRGEARGIFSRKRVAAINDSDFDDGRQGKKGVPNNKRVKPNEHPTSNPAGLGISTAPNPNKRRRTEKPTNAGSTGGATMERVLSATQSSVRGGQGNPRETPVGESRKRNRGGAATTTVNRRRAGTVNSITNSPNLVSSPVIGTFSSSNKAVPSPAIGAAMQRTGSQRARQNSSTSIPQVNRSNAPNHIQSYGNGTHDGSGDVEKNAAHKAVTEAKGTKVDDNSISELERTTRNNDRAIKREESVATKPRPPSISTATRNGGKASKTGTPVASSFSEIQRPRSGRNTLNAALNAEAPLKRSHKKGAGLAAQQAAAAAALKAQKPKDDEGSSIQGDEDEDVEGEPRYCYCNRVSYGEMVACDFEGCEKEWFHLDCAGLTKAPTGKTKWYCDDCKKKLR